MSPRSGHRLPARLDQPGPRAGWLRRTPPALVIGVVAGAVLLSLVSAAAGRPPALMPASGAERYLAPDGHRQILTGPTTQVRETSHAAGIRAWLDTEPTFLLTTMELSERLAGYWVMETEDDETGGRPQLMQVDPSGVHTVMSTWPDARSFSPGRLEVPPDPRPGQRFTSTGSTRTLENETAAYTSELEVIAATDVGPGCLEFRRTDTLGDAAPTTSSRVRCPGRGVVSVRLAEGRWDAAADYPPGADPRTEANLADGELAPLTDLAAEPVRLVRLNQPVVIPPAGPVLQIGDRLVIAGVQTGNVTWQQRQPDGSFRMAVWLDPGGDVVRMARCGEVVVAGNSQRQVQAADARGRWLWTRELDDVMSGTPVRAGEAMLVPTKDGDLRALGCRDGAERWSIGDIDGAVTAAVGTPGVLVAADGGVRLIDPDTGATRWEAQVAARRTALRLDADRALIADENGWLHALAAADGARLWSVRLPEAGQEIHTLGDTVVVRTKERLVGLDARGKQRWARAINALDSVDDGERVVAVDLNRLIVLSADGSVVQETPQAMDARSTEVFLTRTPEGLLAADRQGLIVAWRHR